MAFSCCRDGDPAPLERWRGDTEKVVSPREFRRRALVAVLFLLVVWAVLGVWSAVSGARAALVGRDQIQTVFDEHDLEAIARGDADDELREAQESFDDAAGSLGGWRVAPARWLPVIGRQLRSGHKLSVAASEMIDIGLGLTAEVRTISDRLDAGDLGITDALVEVAAPLAEMQQRAEAIDLGPDEALVGPLASARRTGQLRYDELVDGLARASDGAQGLAAFLEGPSRYLLFAANTAQMQSGMGGLLSIGVVEVHNGDITVSGVRSVSDLPPPATPVPLEADYAARWGWLDPNLAWSSLGTTPRFDITASTAAAMWEATGAEPVDGVLAVDPVALSAVVSATGPVRIEGQQYGAGALLDYLVHGQYLTLTEDIYENWQTFAIAQAERRDHLASIAAQVVANITSDDVDGFDVMIQLADAARGRHVMFWSMDEVQQNAWRAAGVSGELEVDSMLLSLVNRSATKADFYVSMVATISIEESETVTEVVVEVEVTNAVPFGEPRYVAGPHPESDLSYGDHLAIVALNLPGWARNGRVDGDSNLALAGGDGATRVIGSWITVLRDSTETRVFRFELPPDVREFTVEAGARYPVTQWRYGNERFDDSSPRAIEW